jgi:NLI interacting factor-like phosphatase
VQGRASEINEANSESYLNDSEIMQKVEKKILGGIDPELSDHFERKELSLVSEGDNLNVNGPPSTNLLNRLIRDIKSQEEIRNE